ncbi:hypothetical protein OV079_47750 [Nannocystis pusilla]|uniref:Uncharacterized protein n=1 Tax=Nannocystis pusilla TaxID=889268 RepID=A0A9X3EZ87_9BACT|nr:hypothetical protein [Nannocystis pusilla]MCY1013103.1 hypothetical protein [Nannocystis pusilla]
MRHPSRLLPVLSVILACGPEPGATTDASTSTSTAADPPTGAATSETTQLPTTGATLTSDVTTATSDTTTTTTDPGATVTSDTTTTTDPGATVTTTDLTTTRDGETTSEPGSLEFAAIYLPGGLDRIVVRKADHDADLCTSVVFAWPIGNDDPDLVLPPQWGFESAEIAQGAADCLEFTGPLADAVAAETAEGWGEWPALPACPGALAIDMAFTFAQVQPWVPAQALVQAADLPIAGC